MRFNRTELKLAPIVCTRITSLIQSNKAEKPALLRCATHLQPDKVEKSTLLSRMRHPQPNKVEKSTLLSHTAHLQPNKAEKPALMYRIIRRLETAMQDKRKTRDKKVSMEVEEALSVRRFRWK